MHDFIAAACEIAGLRRIPSDRQISTWLRTLSREDRALIEAAEARTIEAATDASAALVAVECEALAVVPLVLRARFA